MKRIGILSDTHGALPEACMDFFKDVDEIWHAGDIGSIDLALKLQAFKPLRAVFGNIDGIAVRQSFPENQIFMCEQRKVLITHIGGYPGRYEPRVKALIASEKPDIYICGHSHILKVMFDKKNNLLHVNPGAAGNSGLHKHITMIRCVIDGDQVKDMEVYEKIRGSS